MDELFGLPAHPLVVHAPIVLIPLAVVGLAVMLVSTTWHERLRWPVLVITVIGTLGAIAAASSGEELEHEIREREGREAVRGLHDHVEAGEMARNLAILFLILLVVYLFLPIVLGKRSDKSQPRWLRPLLMVLVVLAGVGSMISIVDAGHSGAKAVWEEEYDEED
jgi:protein-S-isoprenylcysteine O-methyltransferase Ste14